MLVRYVSFLELKRLSFRAFSILETSLDAGIELDGVKDKDKEGKNSTSRIMVYQRRRRFRIAFRWGRGEGWE